MEGVLLVGKAEFGSVGLDLVWMETCEGLGLYKKSWIMDHKVLLGPWIFWGISSSGSFLSIKTL